MGKKAKSNAGKKKSLDRKIDKSALPPPPPRPEDEDKQSFTSPDLGICRIDITKQPFDYIDVDNARVKLAKLSGVEVTTCYICLEGDGSGRRPLLRDCSCRGSAGWVHFDCLVQYAEKKSEALFEKGRYSPNELGDVWGVCYTCKQEFQNDLFVAMATRYANFIEEQPAYTRKEWDLIESLKCKQRAHFQSHEEEGKQVSRKLLALLGKANASNHLGPRIPEQRLLELEADSYRSSGSFCLMDKDYEDVIEHNERAVDIYKKLSANFNKGKYIPAVADSQRFIQEARNGMSGRGANKCTESELEKQKIIYETAVTNNATASAIRCGLNYSEALQKVGYTIKAQRITTKQLQISQRLHGPNHSLTERASHALILNRYRGMKFEGQDYALMKYKKAKDKYIVRGPLDMGNFTHISCEIGKKSMVSIANCRLADRTPIIIHGLGPPQAHLNGKIGENLGEDTAMVMIGDILRVVSYNIRLEVGGEVRISSENLRILFDVPDEE